MHSSVKKVVVGDGDAVVLALVAYILKRQGFHAEPVVERDQLLDLIRYGQFDAMVVDRHLDGVLDALKAHPECASRVILTSPHDGDNDVGAHALLKKPLEFGQLIETVRGCVDQDA